MSELSLAAAERNPLHELAQVASQIQSGVTSLTDYKIMLDDENVSFVEEGASRMINRVHDLMRDTITAEDDGDPLFCRDIRHDLRNQIAVVKGFSELIRLDLPNNHVASSTLDRISKRSRRFVEILDEARDRSEGPMTAFN